MSYHNSQYRDCIMVDIVIIINIVIIMFIIISIIIGLYKDTNNATNTVSLEY